MPVGAGIGIAGIAGAAATSSAAKSGAKAVQQGTDAATAEQRRQFDKMLELATPGLNRANQAAGLYMSALGFPSTTGPTNGAATVPAPAPAAAPAAGMMTGGASGSYTGGRPSYIGPTPQKYVKQPALATEGGGPAYVDASQLYDSSGGYDGGNVSGGQPSTGATNVPAPQQVGAMTGQPLDIAGLVKATPGYQAQLDQGLKAIDRAAPLVGGMYSGRRMKALNDYGQNTFGSFYNDWLNRVGGMAGQAPVIANQIGQAGMQNAANVGGLMVQGANARAQGSLNSANAWTGAVGDVLGAGLYAGANNGWFGGKGK